MKLNIAATTLLAGVTMYPSPVTASTRRNLGKGSTKSSKDEECECEGVLYYKYVKLSTRTTNYADAYDNTPSGCVLAPITSEADALEINSFVPVGEWAWLGIYKSAADAIADSDTEEEFNWFNLDGSAVPEPPNDGFWATGEPNGATANFLETRAFYAGGNLNGGGFVGVADAPAFFLTDGGVYLCCGEQVNFCVVDPDIMTI